MVWTPPVELSPSLDLAMIGNCSFAGLIDKMGSLVWCCLPRFDGDPVFHSLLGTRGNEGDGAFNIDLNGAVRSEQEYVPNTAIVKTRIFDGQGNAIEITDFAPRFTTKGRMFRPNGIVRRVRPLSGHPRIKVRCRPRFAWGQRVPDVTFGSNHIRWVGNGTTLRMTTNGSVTYIRDETPFLLDGPMSFYLGPDESLTDHPDRICRDFEENTETYWKHWTRRLGLPLEYQEAVIRAAITLKLCTYEETGAIIAAATTSIPEAAGTQRNWDYRYCWIRDAFFVVRALNSLSEMETMENYLRYLNNIAAITQGGHVQPLFGIGMEEKLVETTVDLPGYRGNGPVRVGNQAYEHFQHDVYGQIVLGASQAYFDKRLLHQPGLDDFRRLEQIGERAFAMHDQPDAGIWELRTRARVHTSSSLMCWAACDRLAKIANQFGLSDRTAFWRERAEQVHSVICQRGWNEQKGAFVESFEGNDLDASLLLMAEVGFLPPNDPRFIATVDKIGETLRRGNHLFRYHAADDFGAPENAFNICTFWYIDALARIGRKEEAREIYETMLSCRNHVGLLSEDTTPSTGELWGNFPQTYSMVGIINGAVRLSAGWEKVI
ncbi:glycoside hydrolase family 15 protein [Roseibium polysiphoniae]|uniref:Glycoside hydrolase family 15 protein n=1 Tax=Roseibium polysiphoniae TaxID=2571221 RepID=A0A944CHY1_9HYPH|nr:glycoside hydrolase family 15 protein [Roseibium polysiphoniae]MBD8878695.1 glycoside hydrolase family 15 protein [Roseibium polysiphoniae]MBS8262128.1 glycoside hydrolase family 15 protein [Roseibium polysiphoniae]